MEFPKSPLKEGIDDGLDCKPYVQEDRKETAKGEKELIKETKKWDILVKMERMPFLERLITSKKLSILETPTISRPREELLLEMVKKSIVYICIKCDVPFSFRQNLYQHNMSVHEGKTFTCQVCDRVFKTQTVFINHKKYAHCNIRPYTCSVCNLSFKRRNALVRHSLKHKGPGSFKCNVCQKQFHTRDYMEQHRKTHIKGSGQNICNSCGKAFHAKQTLINHIMAMHTGERPYKCNLCDKSFVQSSYYYQHKRDHISKPVCDICKKSFVSKSCLVVHQKIHSGVKPFMCHVCKETFRRKTSLVSHMLIHQPKQFSCDICKRHFRHKSMFNKHRKLHFKE